MPTAALMPTYGPLDVVFTHGEGCWLVGDDGRRYLDFGAGIAVSALGHAHPKLTGALKAQADRLWHLSNVYRIPEQERLAEFLTTHSAADAVFFTNSGTEAIEAALKAARRYHWANGAPERVTIVGFEGAFHGRTYAAINAAGQPKYREGFGPDLPGYRHVPFGDHDALKAAMDETTAAVIIEPVQGEGGVRPVPTQCMQGLRELCDQTGALFICDEVQTGIGRTGRFFGYEESGVEPDIIASAKGLGGGFPIGACLAVRKVADSMIKGTHGSTYGGGPLACAVGAAVVETVSDPAFLAEVRRIAGIFLQELAALVARRGDVLKEVRGRGLLLGLETTLAPLDVMKAALERELLVLRAGTSVIRLAPPLIVTEEEAREGVARLADAIDAVARTAGAKQAAE